MKELSIEEKAKRYDEAIERARVWKEKSGMPADRQGILDDIFPELKVSEDEEVRKALYEYFKKLKDDGDIDETWYGISYDKILAWLEKQGDKDKLIKELEEYKFKYTQEVLEKHINSMNNKDDERLRKTTISFLKKFADKGYENAVECIDWLEVQDKQILDNSAKTCKDEQKPTDKVKPKFKIEDWVVYHRNNSSTEIMSVYDIRDNRYYFNDNVHFSWSVKECDEKCHLWTIQDAKDGDVLEYQGEIFIIRELKKKVIASRTIEYYCCYDGEHFINNSIYSLMDDDLVNIHPSTQEQHNLLLQKMKEAGYEWDAEKKELKKVVTPIFHIGNRVRYKGHKCDGIITEINDTHYICGNAKLPISTQDKLELVNQKPAWSEEDRQMKMKVLKYLSTRCNVFEYEKVECWLKSLKERIQPQQEWSEEDDYIIEILFCLLDNEQDNYPRLSSYFKDIEKTKIWLKSLKERYTWKPSDEQMKALKESIGIVGELTPRGELLKELVEQLNELMEE